MCLQDKVGQAYDSAAQGAKQAQDYTQVGASGWNTCSTYNCAAQGLEVQLVKPASTCDVNDCVAGQGRPGVRQRGAGREAGAGLHAGVQSTCLLPLHHQHSTARSQPASAFQVYTADRPWWSLQDKAGRAYDSAQQGAKQAGDYTQVRLAHRRFFLLQFAILLLF